MPRLLCGCLNLVHDSASGLSGQTTCTRQTTCTVMLPSTLVPDAKSCRITQRPLLTVTAFILDTCVVGEADIRNRVASWVRMRGSICIGPIQNTEISDSILRSYCHYLNVEYGISNKCTSSRSAFLALQCDFEIVVSILHDGPIIGENEQMATDDENTAPCQVWNLPNRDFLGLVRAPRLC